MSARRRRIIISTEAESDFLDLLTYTEQRWGWRQQRAYKRQFSEAFAELRRFPGLGALRPDFGSGIRGHRVGQHVVIYQPSDTEILILRILHVRRDFDAEFEQGQ